MDYNNRSGRVGGRGGMPFRVEANAFVPRAGSLPPPPQQNGMHGYHTQQGYMPQGYPGQYEQHGYYPEPYGEYGDGYDDFDDDDEIDRAIAEMEAELEGSVMTKRGASEGSESLPPFAHEIWFPECRNCVCCSGFKHGCGCCIGAVKTCTKTDCSSTGTTAPITPSKVSGNSAGGSDKEFWYPESRSCACCEGFKYKCACVTSKGMPLCGDASCQTGLIVPSTEPRKPFANLSDDELIFEPPSEEAPAPVARAAPPAASAGPALCHFFKQGKCRNGASCRFSHG